MPRTIIRIDRDLPLCWEDEQTLRFGFDRPELRIGFPTAATQRIIGALLEGVRSDRLATTLRRLGVDRAEWRATLEMLDPVLVRTPSARPGEDRPGAHSAADRAAPISVSILGSATVASAFREACARTEPDRMGPDGTKLDGVEPERAAAAVRPDLLIRIERFLVPPPDPDRLLGSGVPELPVRFGDRTILIGPILEGPAGPCSECLRLSDAERDPALPVLAAQLVDAEPASETAACVQAAAALGATLIARWLAGASPAAPRTGVHVEAAGPDRIRYRLPVHRGLPEPALEQEFVSRHPTCGCALGDGSTAPMRFIAPAADRIPR